MKPEIAFSEAVGVARSGGQCLARAERRRARIPARVRRKQRACCRWRAQRSLTGLVARVALRRGQRAQWPGLRARARAHSAEPLTWISRASSPRWLGPQPSDCEPARARPARPRPCSNCARKWRRILAASGPGRRPRSAPLACRPNSARCCPSNAKSGRAARSSAVTSSCRHRTTSGACRSTRPPARAPSCSACWRSIRASRASIRGAPCTSTPRRRGSAAALACSHS